MKRFVIGDIHGAYKALMHVLQASGLNYEEDTLICLGDVADGWTEVPECFDELLKIKNIIYILGNHDQWLYEYFKFGYKPYIWTSQGGQNTIDAYVRRPETMEAHQRLLEQALPYYITEDNKLFVHGGFNHHYDIKEHDLHDLMWDRDLFVIACMWQKQGNKLTVKGYDEIFIGHTTTSRYQPDLTPVHVSNVWNLDQGAGWEGKLTLMDVDSKEYWQSPLVIELYPNVKGRR